jgi:hypothetical protein
VKLLDFSVPFWVSYRAMDEPDTQTGHNREGVFGDESGSAIQKHGGQQTVFQGGLVESLKEQLCGFGGSHDNRETEARGVIEEVQSDPFESLDTGTEVLPIAKHHEQSVRVRKPTHVFVLELVNPSENKTHPATGPPDAGAADEVIFTDNAVKAGLLDQFRNRGLGVSLVFHAKEIEQPSAEDRRIGDPLAWLGLETRQAITLVSVQPPINTSLGNSA